MESFVATTVGHELDRDLVDVSRVLAERSGGNAFYLGEMWRHLVSSGRVALVGGRWKVQHDRGVEPVPESVREVEAVRLTTLSASARRVAELMAIGGQRLDLRVLTAATVLPPEELQAAVDELIDARLLMPVGGTRPMYEFVHTIVRDSVEQTVRPGARITLHHQLAMAFEQVYESDRRPVLADLARHFVAAASVAGGAKGVYYSRRAATQAMRSVAYDEAIAHLDAALSLSAPDSVETIDLQLDLGAALSRRGNNQQAMRVFEQAFRSAHERGLVNRRCRRRWGSISPCRCRVCRGTSRCASCRRRWRWWVTRTVRCERGCRRRWGWRSPLPAGARRRSEWVTRAWPPPAATVTRRR